MRCIIGHIQRDKILGALRPGCRMLEWGAGGSTVWFSARMPQGAQLTSVEHDPHWFTEVRRHVEQAANVRLLLREATGPLGANATIEEERPEHLEPFVHAVDGELFDVILVDGNARSACLQQARSLLAPGGVVFLHDAQRAWYDTAKQLFSEYGHIGSCPDYPVPHLWWGGIEGGMPVTSRTSQYPLVISFYTKGTDYEAEAEGLKASCELVGAPHEIVGVPSLGSWEKNCAFKARFIRDMWRQVRRPLLWIDADGRLQALPARLAGAKADFGVHKWQGWEFASGTLFFNSTELAGILLDRWVERCERYPAVWDQVSLDLAWEDVVATYPLETMWLPRSYCQIFDQARHPENGPPVIEHFQASRRLKSTIAPTTIRRPRVTSTLVEARQASRQRSYLLSPADGARGPGERARPGSEDEIVPGIEAGSMAAFVDAFRGLHAGGPVLFLGRGIGVAWRLLREAGLDVRAVEPNTGMQRDGAEFCGDCISQGYESALPFADDSFSSAFSIGLLDTLSDARLEATLAEARRVTCGVFYAVICLTPDPEDRWPAVERNRAWWEQRLARAGFTVCGAQPDNTHTGRGDNASVWITLILRRVEPLLTEGRAPEWSTGQATSRPGCVPDTAVGLELLDDRSLPAERLARMLEPMLEAESPAVTVCWGTGEMGQRVGRALGTRLDYFVDNNPAQHGLECCGRPVRSPAALFGDCGAKVLVLVASLYEEEIRQQIDRESVGEAVRVASMRLPYALSTMSCCHVSVAAEDEAGGETTIDLTGANLLQDDEVADVLIRIRAGARSVVRTRAVARAGRDPLWWEDRFFEAGFRNHPAVPVSMPVLDLGQAAGEAELVFERVPHAALSAYPIGALKAERDLHTDMLREPGVRAWAHCSRYWLARQLVRPGMVALDAACGLGYGAAILATATGAQRVVGVDASSFAIDYARVNYETGNPSLDFHEADAIRLTFLPDQSVDVAVSFETMEHLRNPVTFLSELRRVLKPGGRVIASVPNLWLDDEGKNPVPWHLHVYDIQQFLEQIGRHFVVEQLYRQNAGGGWKRPQPNAIREVPNVSPTAADERDAEWWIVTARR